MSESQQEQLPVIDIESLSHDAKGVGRDENGKVVFVDLALPAETVSYRKVKGRKKYNFAEAVDVLKASEYRVEPKCVEFGECGGCSLQHLQEDQQIFVKQAQLIENLKKLGNVEPEQVLQPLTAERWGYRRKARIGAKYVPKKGGVIIGFRERNSSFIHPMSSCEVLHPSVSTAISATRDLIETLSIPNKIAQIEVAVADNATVFIFRHLEPFQQSDLDALTDFSKQYNIQVFLQPGNLKTVHPLYPKDPEPLYYAYDNFPVKIEFLPTDFIQVNASINNLMVSNAIQYLDIQPDDEILDLFCGVGNFTLPIATQAKEVIGVEGDVSLVKRADHNQQLNKLDNVKFYAADLFKEDLFNHKPEWLNREYSKLLIDPPRSGALEVVSNIEQFNVNRIVYVSCNPATLARDAGILVNEKGYKLEKAGVIDMFPHTAHVESIAVFSL